MCAYYFPSLPGGESKQNWRVRFEAERARARAEVLCFHTKLSFENDVIGIPLVVTNNNASNRVFISDIQTPLDLLSYSAYAHDAVRKDVWKVDFQYWMPLYISHSHWQRAFPLFRLACEKITKRPYDWTSPLDVLPKLMNSMVVSVMNGSKHGMQSKLATSECVTIFLIIKMSLYCHIFHLFPLLYLI